MLKMFKMLFLDFSSVVQKDEVRHWYYGRIDDLCMWNQHKLVSMFEKHLSFSPTPKTTGI